MSDTRCTIYDAARRTRPVICCEVADVATDNNMDGIHDSWFKLFEDDIDADLTVSYIELFVNFGLRIFRRQYSDGDAVFSNKFGCKSTSVTNII